MRNLLLLGLVFICFISFVNANTWCYQETANVSTECGGLDTGSYESDFTVFEDFYDGNWETAVSDSGPPENYVWINYTKPPNSINNSLWQIKDGVSVVNLTIPSPCWDYDNDLLILKVRCWNFGIDDRVDWFCHNSTDWDSLKTEFGTSAAYEDAMGWEIEGEPPVPEIQPAPLQIKKTAHIQLLGGFSLILLK